jgi:acetate kinase
VRGIRLAQEAFGDAVPPVAVFDTNFHSSLPEYASAYAIPKNWADRWHIRRYGFHGLAHRSVLRSFAGLMEMPEQELSVITAHLGSGCSITAIKNGRSVDTSMGFTPLEGLIMSTRSGDLDPAVVAFLAQHEGFTANKIIDFLNHKSGLLALSGKSGDLRELLKSGEERAQLAVAAFCYRIRKYIGAYLAVLGGASAILFSGGIGENMPEIRARICEGLEWLGLILDEEGNRSRPGPHRISADGSRIQAFVIPADEESEIARETAQLLARP